MNLCLLKGQSTFVIFPYIDGQWDVGSIHWWLDSTPLDWWLVEKESLTSVFSGRRAPLNWWSLGEDLPWWPVGKGPFILVVSVMSPYFGDQW